MKKYLLAFLVIALLSAGIVAGLVLVQQNQIFKQRASSPTGTATVSIQPATATFDQNSTNPISIYFNSGGVLIQSVTVRLNFSNLTATAANIQVNPSLLSTGDWTCPVKSVWDNGSTTNVDISCFNSNTAGYSNSTDTLLATFDFTPTQLSPLPITVSFDPATTVITQKSDSTDIALTPTSTGSYTISGSVAQSPTPTPIEIIASPTATPTGVPLGAATPTPIPTLTPTPTAPLSFNATATPTPRATNPPIPVTGFDTPTIIGTSVGVIMLLVGALALIF